MKKLFLAITMIFAIGIFSTDASNCHYDPPQVECVAVVEPLPILDAVDFCAVAQPATSFADVTVGICLLLVEPIQSSYLYGDWLSCRTMTGFVYQSNTDWAKKGEPWLLHDPQPGRQANTASSDWTVAG